MLQVYAINGLVPVVDASAFVHPSAVLIGDVIVGPGVYIRPLASLRGDFGRIIIKAGGNVQDTCVLHGTAQTDTVVDEDGHIGHGAVLHGCFIARNAMVGMNAVVMDGAVIGRSEEHTSELQSLMRISYAVFCLKKKKTDKNNKSEV